VSSAIRIPRALAVCLLAASSLACAQIPDRQALAPPTGTAEPHRTRLYLKDGTYQLVLSYTLTGSVVRYTSAERAGETEEIPARLVDFDATRLWQQRNTPGARSAPVLDPELAAEEAERAAATPEVAPDLRLPDRESVLLLDTFQHTPELVPLTQSDGELNRQTGHNILKSALNPHAAAHPIVQLHGEKSAVQSHIDRPVLYLRIGEPLNTTGTALTVDTHGAPTQPDAITPQNADYLIVRTSVRQDARIITSFDLNALGTSKRQDDVVETDTITLPGNHWRSITPRESLLPGEYALIEILADQKINLGVWDFGVHPTAPENPDAVRPQPKRPQQLEHRTP